MFLAAHLEFGSTDSRLVLAEEKKTFSQLLLDVF